MRAFDESQRSPSERASASFCRHCTREFAAEHRYCPSCGALSGTSSHPTDPLIGRTIAGTYAIRELIGVGGMGRIYRAEQTSLGRSVAVKVVNPLLLTNDEIVTRFYREARAASALNHPNSVSVIDFGRTDDGVLYMVMELLRGRDLSALLEEEGALSIDRACRIMIDVLSALDEAHGAGVVHRDLKPANIFVEQRKKGRDLVKVVDFGIATLATEQSTSVTLPGLLYGTPSYMSPEQVQGIALDGRSDIYAAGAVLFELLTGAPLFSGSTPGDIALCHLHVPPADPRSVAPERGIPDALAELLRTALAKEREQRFASASAMADALSDVLATLPRSQRTSEPRAPVMAKVSPDAETLTAAASASAPAASTPSPAPERQSDRAPQAGKSAPPDGRRPLVGREAQLERLQQLLGEASSAAVFVQITGEVGVGKSSLVSAFAESARQSGHRVIEAGPHPSLAPVAYFPVRALLSAALGIDEIGLSRFASETSDPLVRAGVLEALCVRSTTQGLRLPRVKAVTRALACVLSQQASLSAQPLVIALEDAACYDGASLAVLSQLPSELAGARLLFCTTSATRLPSLASHRAAIALDKLTRRQAHRMLGSQHGSGDELDDTEAAMSPLYLEQLRRLQWSLHGELPRDLGEAFSHRLDRVEPEARRALQAAAVLGIRARRATLCALIGEGGDGAIESLVAAGFLRARGEDVELEHPYLRDLVEASMPAATRAELHVRAHALLEEEGAPIEVRAHHAAEAGDVVNASLLLAEVATAARGRGDTETALSVFHRGWKLARREHDLHAHPIVADVLTRMSRGLSASLLEKGDLAGAEGVLREQLMQCDAKSLQRIAVLLDLGVVVMRRGRLRESHDLLVQALLSASAAGARKLEAFAHASLAEQKALEKNARGELDSLMTAHQLFAQLGTDRSSECAVALRLGAAMHRAGDTYGGASAFTHAQELAAQVPELAAHAVFGLMVVELARRQTAAARRLGDDAKRLAAESGDVELFARIDEAVAVAARGGVPDSALQAIGSELLGV